MNTLFLFFINTASYLFTNISGGLIGGVIGGATSIVPSVIITMYFITIEDNQQLNYAISFIFFSIIISTIGGVLAETYNNSIYNAIICGVLSPIIILILIQLKKKYPTLYDYIIAISIQSISGGIYIYIIVLILRNIIEYIH